MSKRTTPASKTTSETPAPAPRRRATTPVEATRAETPKAPRLRRKTTTTEVTAAAEATGSAAPQPSHDEIAMRAYFISIEQGADPLAAWLLAERELTTA
jgi:hypothetical protein